MYTIPSQNALQSTLDAELAAGATSVTLADDWSSYFSGLSATKPAILVIDRQDANGTNTPSKREYIEVTGVTGATFTISTRGIADSTDQVHSVGARIEVVVDVNTLRSIATTFEVEHNTDGTHGDITADSLTLASGATPTAILDEDDFASDSATALVTQQSVKAYVDSSGEAGGWKDATGETWVYVSAASFKIEGVDLTAQYTKGTRIKCTNSTVKYFVVTSSSFSTDTTVNVTGGTDYVLVNAAITANYYSYQANPQGYPTYFNVAPTVTNPAGATGSLGKTFAKFSVVGKSVTFVGAYSNGTIGGTITGNGYEFTMPVTSSNTSFGSHVGSVHIRQGGSRSSGFCTPNAGSNLIVRAYNEAALTNTTVEVSFSITYEMA